MPIPGNFLRDNLFMTSKKEENKMDKSIFDRPAAWNKLRYKRVYNHELFGNLLFEEYTELKKAKLTVDKLDALADLFFISVGALWKLGINPYSYINATGVIIESYSVLESLNDDYTRRHLKDIVNRILDTEEKEETTLKRLVVYLIEIILAEFVHLKCTKGQATLAITIVCDSNDTKVVGKIHESYKGDLKGENYVSPTPFLNLLATEIDNAK